MADGTNGFEYFLQAEGAFVWLNVKCAEHSLQQEAMKKMMKPNDTIASVISTGAAGTTFEHHVGASFLASLLAGSFLPIFTDAVPHTIHFQATRLGWKTDDLVIEVNDAAGQPHRLLIQAKRTFSISKNDDECRKTLLAAWNDFNNPAQFDRTHDALCLVVHLGTNRLLADFGWLLSQVRASKTAEDFNQRYTGNGVLNQPAKNDYDTVESILTEATGGIIAAEVFWQFLRVFHLLSYDLFSTSSKDEALVKSLLALLVNDDNPGQVAANTWQELLALAARAAGHGESFARADLPPLLQERHRRIASSEHNALRVLRDHSEVILRRTADTSPGGLTFAREDVTAELTDTASNNQVVLIVGAAGSGKSFLAKRYLRTLSANVFTMVFAAEEFSVAHIDTVLSNAQVGLTWANLRTLLALQTERIVLLDGLERLLEASHRAALSDLFHAVADDRGLRLIITCRDYHAQTVQNTMLQPSGVDYAKIVVPDLNDSELDYALQAAPILARPLAADQLRRLLRNPFMLARAVELDWLPDAPLPVTEKALRERLWRAVICRDGSISDAMPERRAAALTRVALDRARCLRPYVVQEDSDQAAITTLAADNIIAFDAAKRAMAPAHDIYEDWALIEWLSTEFARVENDVLAFARVRESHPALRRAYRKWLCELFETDATLAAHYLTEITTEVNGDIGTDADVKIADYLRDDTMVAVFQSSVAHDFLKSFADQLLAHDAHLLCRAIHLVRVACKTISPSAPKGADQLSAWLIPAGSAWENILDFLARHWQQLPTSTYPLILGLLEDWSNGIHWKTPYPPGATSVGALLEKLLPVVEGGWRDKSEKKRVINLIIKIPKTVEVLFKNLCHRAKQKGNRRADADAEQFKESLFHPFQSLAACRDFPDDVIALCMALWIKSEMQDDDSYFQYSVKVDAAFGLEECGFRDFFPISARQGPFESLFRHHPFKALKFIILLVNTAATYYGERRTPMQFVEAPNLLSVCVADDVEKQVWSNERLWNAYRGTSVVPNVLNCALMALEKYLLDAMAVPKWVDNVLAVIQWILSNTNNVALISLVASVCHAYPKETAEVGVALLSCRPFFGLDRQRMVADHTPLAVGGFSYFDQMFQKERIESNQLAHRKHGFEQFSIELQLTSSRDQVWAIFDQHYDALPPQAEQNDDDRLWRLALARMDIRTWEAGEPTENGKLYWQMPKPAPDIQATITKREAEHHPFIEWQSLFLWGIRQFEKKREAVTEADQWRVRLQDAIRLQQGRPDHHHKMDAPSGGPVIVAAICIRDHWEEMAASDQVWCKTAILECLFGTPLADAYSDAVVAHNPYNGVPACCHIVPFLAVRFPDDEQIAHALLFGLLYFNQQARLETVKGVAQYIIPADNRLAAFSIRLLLEHAAAWERISNQGLAAKNEIINSDKSFTPVIHRAKKSIRSVGNFFMRIARKHSTIADRNNGTTREILVGNSTGPIKNLAIEAILEVEKLISDTWYESVPEFGDIQFNNWHNCQLARGLNVLFQPHPQLEIAQNYFKCLAGAIQAQELHDEQHQLHEEHRDYELEIEAKDALTAFMLDSSVAQAMELLESVIVLVADVPDKMEELLERLLYNEDMRTIPTPFWQVHEKVALHIYSAPWLKNIDNEYATGQDLIRASFLNTKWKDGIRIWARLGPHFSDIDRHFQKLPASACVLESYLHYIYHIGEASLPNAFILIAEKFGGELAASIPRFTNIRWYLDALVARAMYENLTALKTTPKLRSAMLAILDALVLAGSSVAFQLRDDFVTPSGGTLS